jgi:hypothetical protein
MITKDLLTEEPLDQFLDNADKFGHKVDGIVIAYADKCDEEVVKSLRSRCDVHLVKIRKSMELNQHLIELGMSREEIIPLLGDIDQPSDGRASYGMSRNHVIIESMLRGYDILVFIDTDVYPEVVIKGQDLIADDHLSIRKTRLDDVFIQEVDFLGSHLKYLNEQDVLVSTSDYTGYYIIPPMQFYGMQNLFYGLKKETAYNYIMESIHHHCLVTDHGLRRQSFRTDKVLGGNVAIKLRLFEDIVPFFSSTFSVEGSKYLTRGEDTVLAMQMKKNDAYKFIDIDTKIFHNTYSHFPTIPDIVKDDAIKDRFFYACMGWIGRNPFLNYLEGLDVKSAYAIEHEHLLKGSKAIAKHLNDERFLLLPRAHDIAYENLDNMKKEFEAFQTSWNEFIRRIRR